VKIAAFIATLLPALWIGYQAAAGELGARPVTEAIHQAGDWTLRFLLMALAITPAQRILRYPRLILARRTLGVAAAGYAALHFSLYVVDQHFDLFKVASEIVLRIYLTIGALGLIGLIALASISTDAAISRLGSSRWHALQSLVYPIAALAVVHFFMQSKLNTYQPVLITGFLIWLLAYRGLYRRIGEVTGLHLVCLAFAAAAVTAVGEAIQMEVRPAWWVLAAGLAVAAIGFWRQRRARQRPSARRISPSAVSAVIQVQSGS
jgi:sulfoxide reductase heme-binding subunit YedZ